MGLRRARGLGWILAILAAMPGQSAWAWSEGGHHLIAWLAYGLLAPAQQRQLQELLRQHPRFEADFAPPPQVTGEAAREEWRIGRAGYWPDVARSQPAFNRPTWHYQLGASLRLGDAAGSNVPASPGPLPEGATLATQELYIAQAVELNRRVLRNPANPAGDRALALTWLAHLVADAHQPCHAGSLYAPRVFPEGDRGANAIPVAQRQNLHALWDGLLGPRFDAGDVRRRAREISSNDALSSRAAAAARAPRGLEPLTWLQESQTLAGSAVYAPEVLEPVQAVSRGLADQVGPITLSESYLKHAGSVAQERAAFAAHRLAGVWSECLGP